MSARILIVDDNATNLKLATEVLAFEGHAVSQAADADEALMLLQSLRPDLILMDIALPGTDSSSRAGSRPRPSSPVRRSSRSRLSP